MELLAKLPRERWAERNLAGRTLLHFACLNHNVMTTVALLQSGLVDVNARGTAGWTAAHVAAESTQPRALELLCAAGADLRLCTNKGYAPIDFVLADAHKNGCQTGRVLVANGVRLSTVSEHLRNYITPELVAFERGVLRCRAAVVSILSAKRKGKLWRWDKFLLRAIAYAVWATRYDKNWQN